MAPKVGFNINVSGNRYGRDTVKAATPLPETETDPVALLRAQQRDLGRRIGSTPAEQAGKVPDYRVGYGRGASQNRDTRTADAFNRGFFMGPHPAPIMPNGPAYVPPISNRGEQLASGVTRQVRYRSPASVVLGHGTGASAGQIDASIAANLARNLDLYDPNGTAKSVVRPAATAGWETPARAAYQIAARYRTPGSPAPVVTSAASRPGVAATSPAASPALLAGNPPPQLGPQMRPQLGDRLRPQSTPAPGRPLQQPGFNFRLPERPQPIPENRTVPSRYRLA